MSVENSGNLEGNHQGVIGVVVKPFDNGDWIGDGAHGVCVSAVRNLSDETHADIGAVYYRRVARGLDIIPIPFFRLRKATAIRRAEKTAARLAIEDNLKLVPTYEIEQSGFDPDSLGY